MTQPPEKKPMPVTLAACCPEAQADGVPCTSLDRDCEECERAVLIHYDEKTDEDPPYLSTLWTV